MMQAEFCRRFVARMVEVAGAPPDGDLSYAEQAAAAAWEEPDQREEGPEACAEADISYWEP